MGSQELSSIEDDLDDVSGQDGGQGDYREAELKRARKQAAAHRIARREAEAAIAELTGELETLRAKVGSLSQENAAQQQTYQQEKERYEQVVKTMEESNARIIEGLPDSIRALVPGQLDPVSLSGWLAQAAPVADVFKQRKPAPPLDGAAGQSERGIDQKALTDTEMVIAQSLGVDPSEYAKRKA